VRGLVAAFSPTLGFVDVDGEVSGIVATAVAALGDAGLHVEAADPDIRDPFESFDVLWSARDARWLESLAPDATAGIDPGLGALAERGARLSASDYLGANDARIDLGVQMGLFHSRYDVLLTPAVAVAPFEAGHDVPPGTGYGEWPRWAALSYPFNLTQQPAAVVPAGTTEDGRPVGLQVVGPRHSDDLVLAVCRMLESARPWHANRPR
jgi:aspartyl-tRNA(Asn)/glutamyl-tRNA(Gln) amidotransferase subunit A